MSGAARKRSRRRACDRAAYHGGRGWASDMIAAFQRKLRFLPVSDPLVWYEATGRHGALDASQPGHNRHTLSIPSEPITPLPMRSDAAEWSRRLAKAEAKAKKLRRHVRTLRRIVAEKKEAPTCTA